MAHSRDNKPPEMRLRTTLGPDLIDQLAVPEPTDDDVVAKTWKIRRGTVKRVVSLADELGLNYGDLVDWMINHVADSVHQGTLDVPVETVSVPAIQGRRQRGTGRDRQGRADTADRSRQPRADS